MFLNLLRNARQALRDVPEERRTIVVRANCTDPMVRIDVCDQGVGIAEADLVRIFRGGHSLRPGGHGLGLHGCANSISALGGRLWASSDGIGHGATFHVELQAAQAGVPA